MDKKTFVAGMDPLEYNPVSPDVRPLCKGDKFESPRVKEARPSVSKTG